MSDKTKIEWTDATYYPILFTGEMVRANLENRKRMTRRVVKPQPPSIEAVKARAGIDFDWIAPTARVPHWHVAGPVWAVRELMGCEPQLLCPYGQPGDRLWVRETWRTISTGMTSKRVEFRADGAVAEPHFDNEKESWPRWRPSIFMPRWASRITLEVTGVRVERVRDISEEDAMAEGIVEFNQGPPRQRYGLPEWPADERQPTAREAFLHLFYGLRKRAQKNENPWVWVIEFKRVN